MSIFTGAPDEGGFGRGGAPAQFGVYIDPAVLGAMANSAMFGATMDPKSLAKKELPELESLLKEQTKISNARSSNTATKKDANTNIQHIKDAIAKKSAGDGNKPVGLVVTPPGDDNTPALPTPIQRGASFKTQKSSVSRAAAVTDEAAAVCNTSDIATKLTTDNETIGRLKQSVDTEKKNAAAIQTRVNALIVQLHDTEATLKQKIAQLAGKSDSHAEAESALEEARTKVRGCAQSITAVETGIGELSGGLDTLVREIEALDQSQLATIKLLDDHDAFETARATETA
jgi:hypothetical protein